MKDKRHIQSFREHQENLNISDVSGSLINEGWRVIDMEEMYDYINKDRDQKTFIKPKFPTRRWGQTYTKTSTWNNGLRNFVGEMIQDGFVSIEDAEGFLTERMNKTSDGNIRYFILPLYQR
jgi:hypothetical protein